VIQEKAILLCKNLCVISINYGILVLKDNCLPARTSMAQTNATVKFATAAIPTTFKEETPCRLDCKGTVSREKCF
jgi:hypothetical protein